MAKLFASILTLAVVAIVLIEFDAPANAADTDGDGRSVTLVLSGGYARYGASTTVPADAEIDASIEMQRPTGTLWMPFQSSATTGSSLWHDGVSTAAMQPGTRLRMVATFKDAAGSQTDQETSVIATVP